MTTRPGIVVVGGSIAAVTVIEELRARGYDGAISQVMDEIHQPYARPPLSKAVLSGEDSAESTHLPSLDGMQVTQLAGVRATGVDPARQRVTLADGETLPYDGLVIATGARALTMRDLGLNTGRESERTLRTLDDAVALRVDLGRASSLVVIGAGVLGMEIASTAAAMGVKTTVVSDEPPMLRLCGEYLSDLVASEARTRGVRVVHDPAGARIIESEGRTCVVVGDCQVHADIVVTCIGDRPNTEWLLDAQLADGRGVPVDQFGEAGPGVVAAGDVASHGRARRRHVHWSAAIDQARTAAATLLGTADRPAYVPRPYFWTDQFGLQLKIAGQNPMVGPPGVVDGDVAGRRAVMQWLDAAGEPTAAVSLNRIIPLKKLHRLAGNRPTTPTNEGVSA